MDFRIWQNNMKAKFTNKVKEKIFNRDGMCCIICKKQEFLQFHHVRFWLEANRWPDRNKETEWITICMDCHLKCHSCKSWEGIREDCVLYLKNLYDI